MPDSDVKILRLRESGIEAERSNVGNILTFCALLGGLAITAFLDFSEDFWKEKGLFERREGYVSESAMAIYDTVVPLLSLTGAMAVYGAFFAVIAARAYGMVLGNIDQLKTPDQIPAELSILAQDTVRTLTRATWYNAIARWVSYAVLVSSLTTVYVASMGDATGDDAIHVAQRWLLLLLMVITPGFMMAWVTYSSVQSAKKVQELVIGDRKLSWHQDVVDNWIDEMVFEEGDHKWHKTNRLTRAQMEARQTRSDSESSETREEPPTVG
jgi:hypothetical protein